MRHHSLKFAAVLFFLAVTGLVGPLFFNRQPPKEEEETVLGNVQNLKIAYERWKAEASQNGVDRKLVLPLGYAKGLSAEFTQAYGQARLDLSNGTLFVEVTGLPIREAFDLWLLDNGKSSVQPELGDPVLRIGRLQHEGATAKLEARINSDSLAQFKLDLMVVTRAGRTPAEAGLLFGSPSLFQRLYYSELRGPKSTGAPSVERWSLLSAPLRALIPGPAYADALSDLALLGGLVGKGESLFFQGTFGGNGRTCGTCHRAENNLTIDPAFIATLPANDPLFVAEFNPALAQLENPFLMRNFGLILENVDGLEDPTHKFTMRGVPHTLAMSTSLTRDSTLPAGPPSQMTGWSGDGAPIDGSLRNFAVGAVTQHFTKSLNRISGTDFILPTSGELDAMEAFQLSGRTVNPNLATPADPAGRPLLVLTNFDAIAGQALFINGLPAADPLKPLAGGKCTTCHRDAGANASFSPQNRNFNTGVEDRDDATAQRAANLIPRDGGFGTSLENPAGCSGAPSPDCGFGNGKFNPPELVDAADTLPGFHNNSCETLEECIDHYNTTAFSNTQDPSGRFILNFSQVSQIAAFLRVINTVENIRSATEVLAAAKVAATRNIAERRTKQAREDITDGIAVLQQQGLHPTAAQKLKSARDGLTNALKKQNSTSTMNSLIDQAIAALALARIEMVLAG